MDKHIEIAKDKIVIWNSDGDTKQLHCLICDSLRENKKILKVLNQLKKSEYLDLYHCANCDSCFFYPIDYAEYHGDDWIGSHPLKFYLDQGIGIDLMVNTLADLRNNKLIKGVLEVGCGVGFAMDFVQREFGWKTTGIEPSGFAEVGKKNLNLNIYADYLENIKELEGQKFELIYGIEVIEHVKDPKKFVQLLKNYLVTNGILAFTTPNVLGVLSNELAPSVLIQILSPGFHINLFSPKGMEILLRSCGFNHIHIVTFAHQLVVYASTQEFTLENSDGKFYSKYLRLLLANISKDSQMYSGILYRLFREKIQQREYIEAEQIFKELEVILKEAYRNIFIPEKIQPLISQSTFQNLGEVAPYYIANLYYYYGLLKFHYHKDYIASANYFKFAYEMADHLQRIAITFFAETSDLFWSMKFFEGYSYLMEKEIEKAIEIFNFILESKKQKDAIIIPQDPIVQDTLYYWGNAELQLGHVPAAIKLFQQVLQMQKNSATKCLVSLTASQLGQALALLIQTHINDLESLPGAKKIVLRQLRRNIARVKFLRFLSYDNLRQHLKKSKTIRWLYGIVMQRPV